MLTLTSVAFGLSVAANVLLLSAWIVARLKLSDLEFRADMADARADDYSAEAEYRLGENIALREQIAELRRKLDSAAVIPTQADDLPAGPAIWDTQPEAQN